MPTNSLQNKLIGAILDFQQQIDSAPFETLIQRLQSKDIIIPEQDFQHVYDLIFLMTLERSDIMGPQGKSLRNLCLECIEQLSVSPPKNRYTS